MNKREPQEREENIVRILLVVGLVIFVGLIYLWPALEDLVSWLR